MRLRALCGLNLPQPLDFETAVAEQPDHVPVRKVELDTVVVRPLEPMHSELGPYELFGDLATVRRTEHAQDGIAEEDELAAQPQQPRRLGNPLIGVAPDRRAVLR
jgi:hypothetical protein